MNLNSDQLLTKTPQGVNATRSGVGLPPKAHALLKLLDGAMPVATFKAACLGASISESDFDAALQELMKRDHLRVAADAAAAPASAAERRMLETLDFTVADELPAKQPQPPAAPAAPTATVLTRPPASAAAGSPASLPAKAAVAEAPAEDKVAKLKLEAEVRQKLIAELQPRIEEELRVKLRPQLEQELRPKLIAALRPGVEAEVRTALTRELTPRVELELKARFAKTLAAQKIAEQQQALAASAALAEPAVPDVPAVPVAPAAPAPADNLSERLLASLSAPLFSVDKNGVCSYVSSAWEQFSGFSSGDTVGKSLAAFFREQDRRAVAALLTGIANGTALRFEQQGLLQRKEGEPLWVEIGAAPLTAPDGALIGACGVIREAAELRRALDQAEADGVRLLLLVDQIDTAVILEDAAGNVQQANAALCTLLSLDAAPYSLEGMPVSELFESAAARFIGADGFLRRVAEQRAAKTDVKGTSFIMANGRVIEQDYLAVTAGDQTVGHVWLFHEMARKS